MNLPEVPTGSGILVKAASDHVSLGWKAENDERARRRGAVVTAIMTVMWLSIAAILVLNAVRQIGQGEFGPAGAAAHVFMLAFSAALAIATGRTLHRIYALPHCEVLVIRAESIEYLEGMRPGGPPPGEGPRLSRRPTGTEFWLVWWMDRRARFDRDALRDVRIEEREGGRRVVLDLGERRYEMGDLLGDAEREWLAEALRLWRGQGGGP